MDSVWRRMKCGGIDVFRQEGRNGGGRGRRFCYFYLKLEQIGSVATLAPASFQKVEEEKRNGTVYFGNKRNFRGVECRCSRLIPIHQFTKIWHRCLHSNPQKSAKKPLAMAAHRPLTCKWPMPASNPVTAHRCKLICKWAFPFPGICGLHFSIFWIIASITLSFELTSQNFREVSPRRRQPKQHWQQEKENKRKYINVEFWWVN